MQKDKKKIKKLKMSKNFLAFTPLTIINDNNNMLSFQMFKSLHPTSHPIGHLPPHWPSPTPLATQLATQLATLLATHLATPFAIPIFGHPFND